MPPHRPTTRFTKPPVGEGENPSRASRLLSAAGFTSLAWHDVYAIIKAVTAKA